MSFRPRKSRTWIVNRYFGKYNPSREDKWVFRNPENTSYLVKFAWTKIVRHDMVKGAASIDDPTLAFAISLGAPFWFDMLNKFMVVRSTVKPHEKSSEETSGDRQSPVARQAGGNGWRASPPGLAPTNASGAPSRSHEWAHGDPQEGVL